MKIVVFENEYESVKGSFEAANLMNFDSKLEIDQFPSSQLADLNSLVEYAVIFIDIDLSTHSVLDGFALIEKIISVDEALSSRIVILTGNNKIKETMLARNIRLKSVKVIVKPTNYKEVTEIINAITIS